MKNGGYADSKQATAAPRPRAVGSTGPDVEVAALQRLLGNRAVRGLLDPAARRDADPGLPGETAMEAGSRGDAPELAEADTATDAAPPMDVLMDAFLVDGSPGAGQMTKLAFLGQLRERLHAAMEEELAGTEWTSHNCPWFDYWFAYYEGRTATQAEAALRRYAPPGNACDASAYFEPVIARVRRAVVTWRATGDVDAPPAAIPRTAQQLAALGPGRALDPGVRSRMERALGETLAPTRIHTDGAAARMASAEGARALAIGDHVAFAAGEYRPGSPVGDGLLAHELAHTIQQRGSRDLGDAAPDRALERSADRFAVGALGRLWGGVARLGATLPALGRTQLRLQRCTTKGVAEAVVPPAPEQLEAAGLPPVVETPDTSTGALPTLDLQGWKPADDDDLLFVTGTSAGSPEKRLFILPAKHLVMRAPTPTATRTVDPARRPVMGMPAAGHAAVHLINAGGGAGFLVDVAGTRNNVGTPDVLVTSGLAHLRFVMKIDRVDDAFVSHAHSDHAGGLSWMVQQGNFSGDRIWLMPGMERFLSGPLGRELQVVGGSKPPGWLPNVVNTTQFTGPTGDSVTRGTLTVGQATIEMAVGTTELAAYVNAVMSNDPRASKLADAATPVQRIRWANSNVEVVVGGDLRGRDFKKLHEKMGDVAFRQLVGNARILVGLHHLGAVQTAADVDGLKRMLRAMGAGSQPITVLAQVGPDHEVNTNLIEALRTAGARVVIVGEPDPSKPDARIQVRTGGSVSQVGGKDFASDPVTRTGQRRLSELDRSARTLERLSEYHGVAGASRQEVLDGVRAEADRLRQQLAERQELALDNLHRGPRSQQATEALEANRAALERVDGMAARLGSHLAELARSTKELTELEGQQRHARQVGATSQRLRQLIAQIDPAFARAVILEETGAGGSRKEMRNAWRRVEKRLSKQAELHAGMEIKTFPARAKGPAYLGLALQLFELAAPAIEEALHAGDDQDREDFYMFYRDLVWWNEKGIALPARGTTAGGPVTGSLTASAEQRLYQDTPKDRRGDFKLSDATAKADALKTLWVPELSEWSAEQRTAFFDALRIWLDAHVNDIEDYFAELKTGIAAPIRPTSLDGLLGDGTWQIHVGVARDGHIATAWQDSDELTRIMNATIKRVRAGTEQLIKTRSAPRPAGSVAPMPDSMGTPGDKPSGQGVAGGYVVGKLTVRAKAARFYSLRGSDVEKSRTEAKPEDHLHLLELDRRAPSGFVWVIAGDYVTYLHLRGLTDIWRLAAIVQIPKAQRGRNPNSPDFDALHDDPPRKYMNDEQLEAWLGFTSGTRGYVFEDKPEGPYRGSVRIYETGSNIGGMVLMRRKDLGPDQ